MKKSGLARFASPVGAYLVATGLVAAAAIVHVLIDPIIHPSSPYALFYLAILVSAWFFGPGPGILSAGLSAAVVETLLVLPQGYPLLRILPFAFASAGIIAIARIAQSIRGSEERANAHLAAIVHSTDDAIVSKDLNGIIQNCNPACERLFGYTAAELIGKPVTILIPPELQDEEPKILARMRRGERIDHFETVRIRKDGRRVDVSLTISPVRNANGEIIAVSKVARDITEVKAATRQLDAQREWLRVTLASIGDAVIATDEHLNVAFMNPVAERLTGWRSVEATGQTCDSVFRLLDQKTRQWIPNVALRLTGEGEKFILNEDMLLVARDGTERPIEDSGAPILGRDGRILGVVLVFRDASDKRILEAERQAASADRDRLLEAERIARAESERANRVKDDFVAVVSHELRTPLNAILGWTDVLLHGKPDQQQIRGLEVIRRNTQVQAQLIADLLDISRVVSGKLLLDVQEIDLVRVIDAAIETVQHSADARGIVIARRFSTLPAVTAGDPGRLQQVLWNLLTNAIKFTPPGGTIDIDMRRLDTRTEISVSDTGIGLQPETLDRIFDRFHQQDSPSTRRHGGLGLGLAIVRHLVDLHGGEIWAASDGPDRGARFTVSLPVTAVDVKAAPTESPATSAIPLDSRTLRDLRVLVVEDEVDNRDVIRRLLEAHGAEVVTAGTAEEAVEQAANSRPDILVSDIGLPDVDGYELIRRFRRNEVEGLDGIPAVALTAFARSEDRTRALRAGYQAHIAKPVEPAELVATLASFADLLPASRFRP